MKNGGHILFKKVSILFCLFLMLCCVNSVCASDNITVDCDEYLLNAGHDVLIENDGITYEVQSKDKNINLSNFECCSFIIQEQDQETIYGFRQDAPLNGKGVVINEMEWNGMYILKQEIESDHAYFFHSIITENGWVIGEGGSQYNQSSRNIEQIAAEMVINNDISQNSLNKIKNILYGYGYGHFIIKAPDGRYGISFMDNCLTGKLQVGQYIVIPNDYKYYHKGNYKNYASNPVNAIVSLCSYDYSGLSRRNLYIYDYNAKETIYGVFKGVDIYVTNDNGYNVGLDTSKIVTHFYYKGKYFDASSVPQMPGKLFVGTHIFESQYYGDTISLIQSERNVLLGNELSLYYRINYITSPRTIIFDLSENVDFINAVKSHGDFNYDSSQHRIYWHTPSAKDARDIIITIKPKTLGNINVFASIEGMTEINNFNYYVTDYGVNIHSTDVEKYKGGPERLTVSLTDRYGVKLIGETVSITINGETYYRQTSADGFASLAINLGSGEYDAVVKYDGKIGKDQTDVKIFIKPTSFANDTVKYYRNATQFQASFLDGKGNILKYSNVQFNINGMLYTRTTDENGIARLNINLEPNKYIITSINLATGEQISNSIIVKSVLVENNDLVKYYKNQSQFSVKVLDGKGRPLANGEVIFNINGVFYTRLSDENGIAKLNINLGPGKYIITSTYNGASVSNNIQVLTRLLANDLTMKYKDGSTFNAIVLNEQGRVLENESVTFNINGLFYNRTTDSKGIAKLNINLMAGEYIITSYWDEYSTSNKITIS